MRANVGTYADYVDSYAKLRRLLSNLCNDIVVFGIHKESTAIYFSIEIEANMCTNVGTHAWLIVGEKSVGKYVRVSQIRSSSLYLS